MRPSLVHRWLTQFSDAGSIGHAGEDASELNKATQEASQVARNVFAIHFSVHAYAFLTVAGISDADFLRPLAFLELPVVGIKVPIPQFFRAMPILSAGVALYLQLYMGHLAMLERRLTVASKQNRKPYLDYPWIHTFASTHHPAGAAAKALVAVAIWGLSPVFWLYCCRIVAPLEGIHVSYESLLNYLQCGAVALSATVTIWSAVRRLVNNKVAAQNGQQNEDNRRGQARIVLLHVGVFATLLAAALFVDQRPRRLSIENAELSLRANTSSTWRGPKLNNAYLEGLSARGAVMSGATLEGARLAGSDLRGGDFVQANLDRAELRCSEQLGGSCVSGKILCDAQAKVGATRQKRKLTACDGSAEEVRYCCANLQGAILNGALLANAQLSGANLLHADLSDANMTSTDLADTDLQNATLDRANLRSATLTNAKLNNASIKEARLGYAKMNGADFSKAKLNSTEFIQAQLESSRFSFAVAPDAVFEGAMLGRSEFDSANLARANLTKALLGGSILRHAELPGALLHQADLSNADLTDAELGGVQGSEVILVEADLISARLERAHLPGARLMDACLLRATITDTTLRRANLAGAVLKDATASSSTDFRGADLQRTYLLNVDLSEVIMDEATNLRGAFFSQHTKLPKQYGPWHTWEAKYEMIHAQDLEEVPIAAEVALKRPPPERELNCKAMKQSLRKAPN